MIYHLRYGIHGYSDPQSAQIVTSISSLAKFTRLSRSQIVTGLNRHIRERFQSSVKDASKEAKSRLLEEELSLMTTPAALTNDATLSLKQRL